MNPLNQLPIDPELIRRNDEFLAAFAKETGQMVLLLALKEGGKAQISLEGVPASGPLAELGKDVPRLLQFASLLCSISDALEKGNPQ